VIKAYLTQIRQETYVRFLELAYARGDREPDKWWICFAKRKFLNKSL
jgi:actin related protein 2/3 complex subunit 3